MELTMTHLRYLLTIYTQEGETTTVSTVARTLGVSKPSVTRMLGTLMDKGLLVQERYGKVVLTDAGKQAARDHQANVAHLRLLIPRMGLNLTGAELEEAGWLLASWLPEHARISEAPAVPGEPEIALSGKIPCPDA